VRVPVNAARARQRPVVGGVNATPPRPSRTRVRDVRKNCQPSSEDGVRRP
jgi:hypothetical protein